MDTKKLYIKSQKNVLTWGLVISAIFFTLSLVSIFTRKNLSEQNIFDFWVNLIIYTSVFTSLLYNRIKINVKSAKIALFCYLALVGVYIVTMTIRAKQSYDLFKTMNFKNPLMAIVLGYGSTILVMAGVTYLLYRVYMATKNVETLSQPE